MGSGHIMRCLALAQAWLDRNGSCILVTAMDAGPLIPRLQTEGVAVRRIDAEAGSGDDARATLAVMREAGARHLVLDGYHFSADYQRSVRQGVPGGEGGVRLLVVDDNGEQAHYHADLVLNQNIHAAEALYPPDRREPHTRLLLGLEYCLLRREFLKHRGERREAPPVARNILVTFGGSDPGNATLQALQAIQSLGDASLRVKVVVGGNNPHGDALARAVRTIPGQAELIRDAQDMAELMLWADLAVSAAGSTVWEMCLLGLPCLLVVTAENQEGLARRIQERGLACGVYRTDEWRRLEGALRAWLDDQARRDECSRRMQEVVGGGGARKVLRQLMCGTVRLRPAKESDARILWEWANDPVTRRYSFSSDPIPWEGHLRWYREKLASSGTRMYVACTEAGAGGALIRFEIRNGAALVGVTVAPEYRGLGLAAEVIGAGTRMFLAESGPMRIDAFIKPDNRASRSAFEKCGYSLVENTVYDGQECLKFCHEN
jgi:UDP-2,4-diacetamido-2,4,6-trideoxy-beta-L-altropyranose hydrolase